MRILIAEHDEWHRQRSEWVRENDEEEMLHRRFREINHALGFDEENVNEMAQLRRDDEMRLHEDEEEELRLYFEELEKRRLEDEGIHQECERIMQEYDEEKRIQEIRKKDEQSRRWEEIMRLQDEKEAERCRSVDTNERNVIGTEAESEERIQQERAHAIQIEKEQAARDRSLIEEFLFDSDETMMFEEEEEWNQQQPPPPPPIIEISDDDDNVL